MGHELYEDPRYYPQHTHYHPLLNGEHLGRFAGIALSVAGIALSAR